MQWQHAVLIRQPCGAGITQQIHNVSHIILTVIVVALALVPKQDPVAADHPPAALAPLGLTPEEGKVKAGPLSSILCHLPTWKCPTEQLQHLQTGPVGTRVVQWNPPVAVLPTGHLLLARDDPPHHIDGRVGQLAQKVQRRGAELPQVRAGHRPLLIGRVGRQPLPQRLPRPLQLRLPRRPLLGRHLRLGRVVRPRQRRLADGVEPGDVVDGAHVVGPDGAGPQRRGVVVVGVVLVRGLGVGGGRQGLGLGNPPDRRRAVVVRLAGARRPAYSSRFVLLLGGGATLIPSARIGSIGTVVVPTADTACLLSTSTTTSMSRNWTATASAVIIARTAASASAPAPAPPPAVTIGAAAMGRHGTRE